MGEEIKVIKVEAENDGTLIQVDFKTSTEQGRLFIEVRDIYKALNNYAYLKHDKTMLDMGFELEDPENYVNPKLIN